MPENKSIQQLEDRMSRLGPGTIRYEALEAAKRFKSSWLDLGRVLWTVHKEKKFKEWGYLTFEAYCAKEIGIRAATAKKLLYSYYFLEKEEPTLLKRLSEEPPANHPHVDAINALRLLKDQQKMPTAEYQKVRSYVLEKGKEPAEVRREVRSMLEQSQPDPESARAARRQVTIRRMIGTLKTIRTELTAGNLVPKNLLAEIDAVMKKLIETLS